MVDDEGGAHDEYRPGINVAYGPSDGDGVATIRSAHDLDVTFFDTAERHGWGREREAADRNRPPHSDEHGSPR